MLQAKNRLRKMKDIDILMKEGRFIGGDLVTLKVWWVNPNTYPRRAYSKEDLLIGFAVGKKVHKSAVQRNRIKRQMREVVRLFIKNNSLKAGAMVFVIAKKDIVGAPYSAIEASLRDTFRKAKLFV